MGTYEPLPTERDAVGSRHVTETCGRPATTSTDGQPSLEFESDSG